MGLIKRLVIKTKKGKCFFALHKIMKKLIFLALLFSCIPQIKSNISQQAIRKSEVAEAQKAEMVKQVEIDYSSQIRLEALRSGTTYTLGDYTYDSKYETDHFLFYYNSSLTPYNVTTEAGNVFETVRTKYVNLGFRNPILESGQSKYRVGLSTDNTGALGTTTYWPGSKTSKSYITIRHLSNSITSTFKETVAHEYLHAIQNAYNIDMGWFKEACAGWGEFFVWGKSYTTANDIANFINNHPSLTDSNYKYGAAAFPLTLSRRCSNYVVRRVFEGFANMDGSYTDQKFVDIVNNALSQSGYSIRFPQILNAMHSYMVKPTQWYREYGANEAGVNWSHTSPSQSINITTTKFEGSVTGTITKLTGKYIKFNISSGIKGDINYSISFNNSNGISSKYVTFATGGSDYIYTCSQGSISSSIANYGIDYSGAGLVLTNPNLDQTIRYTIHYSVSPKAVKTGQTNYIYFEPEDLNYYYGYYGEYMEWYELQGSISIGNVPSASWETVEILGYESDVEFFNDQIYFYEEDGVFNYSFYTHDPNASGRVRIKFSYIANLSIQVRTVNTNTSFYFFSPDSFELFSGHGQDWYILNFTLAASEVPQDFMHTVTENGYQAFTFISFFSGDIYFDQNDGLFYCTFQSHDAGFGMIRIPYTYTTRTLPTA